MKSFLFQIELTVSEDGVLTVVDQATQKVLGTAATTSGKDGHSGTEIQTLTVQQLHQMVNHWFYRSYIFLYKCLFTGLYFIRLDVGRCC